MKSWTNCRVRLTDGTEGTVAKENGNELTIAFQNPGEYVAGGLRKVITLDKIQKVLSSTANHTRTFGNRYK